MTNTEQWQHREKGSFEGVIRIPASRVLPHETFRDNNRAYEKARERINPPQQADCVYLVGFSVFGLIFGVT